MPGLDYLTTNGLLTYPFKDNVTLTNGTTTIPQNFLLDALVVFHTAAQKRAFVSTIAKVGSNVVLTVKSTDANGTVLHTTNVTVAVGSVAEKEFFSYSDVNISLKFVAGQALVTFAAGSETTADYTLTQTELSPGVIILYTTRVESVSFYKTGFDSNTEEYTHTLVKTYTDEPVDIGEGTNISFKQTTTGTSASVFPSLGAGLYDPCAEIDAIYTINFLEADVNGNFLINTDDCYVTTVGESQLSVENICTPRCEPEHLINFAHYLNRIKSGMLSIATLANGVYADILAEVTAYYATVLPTRNQPTYKVKYTRTTSPGCVYFGFIIGIFNPTNEDLVFTSTVTKNAAASFVDPKYTQGTDLTVLASPNTTQTVPCLSTAIINFVVSKPGGGPHTVTVNVTGCTAIGATTFNVT